MILYSKNGDFLGIGKDELSFLGYEDLEEFKSLHSDVAELFVNKPGYIFKFKNFSWIDYALHSGAPKKSVILKLKTGNEVEVPLKIKEVFLYSPKENEDIYYSIELTNDTYKTNSFKNESTLIQSEDTSSDDTKFTPEPLKQHQEDLPHESKEVSFEDDWEEEPKEVSFEEDFLKESIETTPTNIGISQADEPTMKLKIDTGIYEDEISLPKIDDTKKDILITTNFEEDYETENNIEPKADNINIKKEDIEEDKDFSFDLLQCVEESGLDISIISELLTDYINKIDDSIPTIRSYIDSENEVEMNTILYELKGISDNLHILELSNTIKKILEAKSKNDKIVELNKFENIITKFRGELI